MFTFTRPDWRSSEELRQFDRALAEKPEGQQAAIVPSVVPSVIFTWPTCRYNEASRPGAVNTESALTNSQTYVGGSRRG